MAAVKAFSKDIIMYEGEYLKRKYDPAKEGRYIETPHYALFIKITDYSKGYWAEAPIERDQLKELRDYLTQYLRKNREWQLA